MNVSKLATSLALGAALALASVSVAGAITVSVDADDSPAPVSGSGPKLSVTRAATGKLGLKKGASYKLQAKAPKAKVVYKSSKAKVVTVSKKGVLKAKRPGKATVTVTAKSGGKKTVRKVKVTVFKKSKYTYATSMHISSKHTVLNPGGTGKVTATVMPKKASNRNVVYKSTKTSVLTVDADGTVTAKKKGTAKVVATSCETSKLRASVMIKVKVAKSTTTTPAETKTVTYEPDKKVSVPAISKVAVKAGLGNYSWAELKSIANAVGACSTKADATALVKKYNLVNANGKIAASNTKGVKVTYIQNLGKAVKWTETHQLQLLGYWHDTKASGGKAGLTFGFEDSIGIAGFNVDASTDGGWKACSLRTKLANTYYKMLPGDLRTLIVSVSKKTNNAGGEAQGSTSAVTTTSDKVWVPSAVEVYGSLGAFAQEHKSIVPHAAVLNAEGAQYQFFADNGADPKSGCAACKKKHRDDDGTKVHFWRLRSSHTDDSEKALIVDKTGALIFQQADSQYGISPAFCF